MRVDSDPRRGRVCMLSQPKISNLGTGQRIKPAGRSEPNLIPE